MQFVNIAGAGADNSNDYNENVIPSGWSHRNTATIGFDTASFDVKESKRFLEELFYYGLAREVIRYSADGNRVVFHGYIHEMTLTEPGMRARTSIDNLYNSVAVEYTQLNTANNPPTETETTSAYASDTDSQDQYGIREFVFKPPIEKMTSTMASQIANTILAQYKSPRQSADYTLSDAEPRLHIVVKGYMHTLGWRYYTQTVNSGTQTAQAEIQGIVTADGQFIDSTDLGTNGTSVNKYRDENRTALETILNIASVGDANYNRWVAHIFDDKKLIYKQASESIKYYRRLADPKQQIYDTMRRPVPPWEIRPDAWLRTDDVQPFAISPSNVEDDKQSMYIESVEWIETNNMLLLTGSKGDGMRVLVARASALGNYVL